MSENNQTPSYIQSIYYNLVSNRNMLVSDFQAISSNPSGAGFCDSLKNTLKQISELEVQINVLLDMYPSLNSDNQTEASSQKSSTHGVISGEPTALHKDAKVVSKFS